MQKVIRQIIVDGLPDLKIKETGLPAGSGLFVGWNLGRWHLPQSFVVYPATRSGLGAWVAKRLAVITIRNQTVMRGLCMDNEDLAGGGADMNWDVPDLNKCEMCQAWMPDRCADEMPYYPDHGEFCPLFVREPGVEG